MTRARAQKETDTLQGEISRFFERTQKTNYGAVSKEMKDSRASDELDRLGGLIGENIAMEASGGLGQWSERFNKWGDKLEPKPDSSAAGRVQAANRKTKDLTEQLIALVAIARKRDELCAIKPRSSTSKRAIHRPTRTGPIRLLTRRKSWTATWKRFSNRRRCPQLDPAFAQTAAAMKEVESVLQTPETGKPADQAEGKTIDSLSDLVNLINEQAQQEQPATVSRQLQQRRGNGLPVAHDAEYRTTPKPWPSSPPPASIARAAKQTGPAIPSPANASGKGAATRDVNKASGVIENSPPEFRDALDIYFHGIEQSKD